MSKPKPRSDTQSSAVQMAPATASASESGSRQMDETEFLLSSPENAWRLRESIAQIRAGKVVTVDPRDLGIDV